MENLHEYVPTESSTVKIQRPYSDKKDEVTLDNFHYTLMGGDQLTVARARGSQRIRRIHFVLETGLRVLFLYVKTGMLKEVCSQ